MMYAFCLNECALIAYDTDIVPNKDEEEEDEHEDEEENREENKKRDEENKSMMTMMIMHFNLTSKKNYVNVPVRTMSGILLPAEGDEIEFV